MKAVILAGGLGTRLGEETDVRPKPMVEIGGRPILWHIMKIYSQHGINDFVVCLGYKGYIIKEYFFNYRNHMSSSTIDLKSNSNLIHEMNVEPWTIGMIDTEADTQTGGRVRRIRKYLDRDPFLLTYGDGVGDVDIRASIEFHKKHGKKCTITAVQPPGRFGALKMRGEDSVESFVEKPQGDGSWINGGFFVCDPSVIDYIADDSTIWEKEPLQNLARDGELKAFFHRGFWQPMDTLRDKRHLEDLWKEGKAPWKTW